MLVGVVLAALIVNCSAWYPDNCGRIDKSFWKTEDSRSKRIIGGRQLEGKMVPWLIRIDSPKQFTCTGTMITSKLFLTAGHCFTDRDKKTEICDFDRRQFTACRLVDTNNETCSKMVIKKIHNLQPYVNSNCHKTKDFVIGELEKPIEDKDFSPICLPTKQNGIPRNYEYKENVFSFGFSRNQENNKEKYNMYLKYAMAGKPRICDDGLFLCTLQRNTSAICRGDSGGPMVEIHQGKAMIIGVNDRGSGICDFDVILSATPSPPLDRELTLIVRKHAALLNQLLGRKNYTFV